MKNHLNILAIEGCQGVGKTTLLNKLAGGEVAEKFPLLSKIERPRTFNHPDNGAGLSLITDLLWYTSAVQDWFKLPDAIPKLIDRFIVSQWVYGKLRTDDYIEIPFDGLDRLEQSMDEFLYAFIPRINQEFRRRIVGDVPYITQTNLVYLFVIPDVDIINHRRKFSMNTYVYTAAEEHHLYTKAFNILDARNDISCIYVSKLESDFKLMEKIHEAFLSFSS